MFSLLQIQKMNQQYDKTHKVHKMFEDPSITVCGLWSDNFSQRSLTDNWQLVTCKMCLKKM